MLMNVLRATAEGAGTLEDSLMGSSYNHCAPGRCHWPNNV